jgi:site-specific DNA-methyltransferase (adenine-specific)
MLDTVAKAWADSNSGANIWADKNVRFLDPFTKSGVFLREIVRRLSEGLEKEIPDLQDRINHIVSKQVFGMAITQLTALTTRRSVYCSKRANGKHSIATIFNDEEGSIWFKRTEHTWTGGAQKVITVDENGKEIEKKLGGKCKHCGASQSEYERDKTLESHAYALIHTEDPKQLIKEVFGEEMQFDVIIGNPPYQLSAGETSDTPIYQQFVLQAMQLEPRLLAMVTPSRWFTGGKNLDDYRKVMISDRRIRKIVDFPNSKETFPGVEIKGGVSYFLWDRDKEGDCEFSTFSKGELVSSSTRDLRDGQGVVIRDNIASEIVKKVLAKKIPNLVPKVSPQTPFGLYTNFSDFVAKEKPGFVRLYKRGLEDSWVDPKHVLSRKELIPYVKVLMSYAYNGGDALPHQVTGKPFVVAGNSVCTQTYMVAGVFNSTLDADNLAKFLSTRFVRFLIRQRKISQHNRPDTFGFVPDMDMSKSWDDLALFDFFEISESERQYIFSQVKEITLESEIED